MQLCNDRDTIMDKSKSAHDNDFNKTY